MTSLQQCGSQMWLPNVASNRALSKKRLFSKESFFESPKFYDQTHNHLKRLDKHVGFDLSLLFFYFCCGAGDWFENSVVVKHQAVELDPITDHLWPH